MAKQNLDSYAAYALESGARMTPHPLQFKAQTRVDASRDELWAFVTDFTRIGDFIPMIKRSYSDDSNAEAPGQVGAVRPGHVQGAVDGPLGGGRPVRAHEDSPVRRAGRRHRAVVAGLGRDGIRIRVGHSDSLRLSV